MESTDEPLPHVDRKVENIILHPKHIPGKEITKGYDVALLKLSEPIDYSAHILPICLPKDDKLLVDEIALTQGLGKTGLFSDPTVLQELSSRIISNDECRKIFRQYDIPNIMICQFHRETRRKATCSVSQGLL